MDRLQWEVRRRTEVRPRDLTPSVPCASDTWYEQSTLTTVADVPLCGPAEIVVYLTSGGRVVAGLPAYVNDWRGNLQENVVVDFGIGNASQPAQPLPVSVVQITVNVDC